MKIKCKCGKLATWGYMPSDNDWYCCDDCVPRGCSCNEYSIKECYGNKDVIECKPEGKEGEDFEWRDEATWRDLVEGKLLPCCEWYYDEEGWENG